MYLKKSEPRESINLVLPGFKEEQKWWRFKARIKKLLQKGKAISPLNWYDGLLDDFEIDFTELNK